MTQRVSTEAIVQAYQATGSVWAAGRKLGLAGQSVHERLQAVGYPLRSRMWTQEEYAELRRLAEEGLSISEMARRLGRPYAGVALKLSRAGIPTQIRRQKKIPRGAGYDKASVRKHLRALTASTLPITRYARANGLNVESLARAIQRHFPEEWTAYVREHSDVPERICGYCGTQFIPANARQMYCTRKCASDGRSDRSYFGGKRSQATGMATGECQLCLRVGMKGLSAHHILGKENDPENAALIALCQGCHKLVTLAASRTFVENTNAWEAFIALVWLRRFGAERTDTVLEVVVDLDTYPADELSEEVG